MPKDITKSIRESMIACYSEDQTCESCIHYDDTKYPECMKELIKDGCNMIIRLYKSNARMRRKLAKMEEELILNGKMK